MSWTDERVDTLKRLWGEGLSASQIAGQLGGVSRNAVIGKVHRLGLESRIKKEAAASQTPEAHDATAEAPAAPAQAEPGRAEPASAGPMEAAADVPVVAPVADNDAGLPAAEAGSDEDDVVVPVPRRLKLTQLTERTCKWPIGDPMHDDFHFCGHDAEEGRPYCEYHSGLAFQPASERRRVR